MRYDRDIVSAHDELLEQINQAKQLNNSSSDQFSTIDQWETSTIEIVKRTAERARVPTILSTTKNVDYKFVDSKLIPS